MVKKVSTVQEIQQHIRKEKQIRKQVALKKMLRYVLLTVAAFVMALGLFWYHQSPYSRVNRLIIENNVYLSDEEVSEIINFKLGKQFYTFFTSSVENSIPKNTLIESIQASKNWLDQSMTITVKEKPIVGYKLSDKIDLIASDGSVKSLYSDQVYLLKGLLRISGFDDEASLKELASALQRSDKVLLNNISEIIQDPRSYDEKFLRVMMSDGIVLSTSIYSLEKLDSDTFKEIVNNMKPTQKCVVYDVFWNASYSKECEVEK